MSNSRSTAFYAGYFLRCIGFAVALLLATHGIARHTASKKSHSLRPHASASRFPIWGKIGREISLHFLRQSVCKAVIIDHVLRRIPPHYSRHWQPVPIRLPDFPSGIYAPHPVAGATRNNVAHQKILLCPLRRRQRKAALSTLFKPEAT